MDGKPGKDGTSALGMAFSGDVHVHPGGKIIGGGGGGGGGGGAGQKDAVIHGEELVAAAVAAVKVSIMD